MKQVGGKHREILYFTNTWKKPSVLLLGGILQLLRIGCVSLHQLCASSVCHESLTVAQSDTLEFNPEVS